MRAAAQPGGYVIAQDVLLQSGKVVKKFFKGLEYSTRVKGTHGRWRYYYHRGIVHFTGMK